jgi:hypothetical protein
VADLLANGASEGFAAFLAPYAAAAAASGVPFVVGEAGSASCGGAKGVSDVFASALFSLDVMMETAAIGVDQWNCVSTVPPPPLRAAVLYKYADRPPPLAHTPIHI